MSEKLNFKYGGAERFDSVQTKEDGTIYAVNEAFAETPGDAKRGSIYRGDKIIGTTVADKLVTNSEIVIAGGPIAAEGIFEGNKIPAGTSIQEVLVKLLCQELYPDAPKSGIHGEFAAQLANPTITIKNGSTSLSSSTSTYVEAGSVLSCAITAGATSVKTNKSSKVEGFEFGYKDSETGEVNGANSIVKDWDYDYTEGSEYEVSVAINSGFTGLATTSAKGATTANASIAAQDITVGAGANKLTVTEKGRSYDATVEAIASKFIVSNLGNVSADEKSAEVAGASSTYAPSNSSAVFQLTGVYPAYSGLVSSANPTADQIKALTKTVSTKKTLTVKGPMNNQYICVACPPGWSLSSALDPNGFENFGSFESSTVKITGLDGTEQSYTVYIMGPTSQDANFTMTLK